MLVHGSAHGAWLIPYPRTHLAGSAPGSGRGLSLVHFFVILLKNFVPDTPLWGAGSGMAPCGPHGTPSRRLDRLPILGHFPVRKFPGFALPHLGAGQLQGLELASSKGGQNILEEFSAKFGFTPTPNRWELRLALSVGGGLGGGPALRGWGSPLPTCCGLGGATKGHYFFRDL